MDEQITERYTTEQITAALARYVAARQAYSTFDGDLSSGEGERVFAAWEQARNRFSFTGIDYVEDLLSDNAKLRTALARLVGHPFSAVSAGQLDRKWGCAYCSVTYDYDSWSEDQTFDHAPDCPITLGRQALAGGG